MIKMENQKRIIKKLDKYKKDKKERFRDILNDVILHYSNKNDFDDKRRINNEDNIYKKIIKKN